MPRNATAPKTNEPLGGVLILIVGEHPLEQTLHAVADVAAGGGRVQLRQAEVRAREIRRGGDVGARVDEGAVEIEENGAEAGQATWRGR